MGCQTEIARQMVDREVDYCLAVEGNQPTLHPALIDFFIHQLEHDFAQTKVRRCEPREQGHVRNEERTYFLCPVPDDLPDRERWAGVNSIGLAINQTVCGGKASGDVRYYIVSRYVTGAMFTKAVRTHWSIENELHWRLDVTIGED